MLAQRLPGLSRTPQQERRQSFRVEPAPFLVKELAVWFMKEAPDRTLTLEDIGFPHVMSLNGASTASIVNISSLGMRLSIAKRSLPATQLIKQGHCYIYMKLRSPIPGKCNVYCLMLGITLLGASDDNGMLHFRAKITSRAMAAHSSKSFLLFNVERFGVKELSVWCKEITRMGRGLMPPVSPGLDMEYILPEIALLKSQEAVCVCPVPVVPPAPAAALASPV